MAGTGKHAAALWRTGRSIGNAPHYEENPPQDPTRKIYDRPARHAGGTPAFAGAGRMEMGNLTMCDIRYPILLLDADRTLFDFEASQAAEREAFLNQTPPTHTEEEKAAVHDDKSAAQKIQAQRGNAPAEHAPVRQTTVNVNSVNRGKEMA